MLPICLNNFQDLSSDLSSDKSQDSLGQILIVKEGSTKTPINAPDPDLGIEITLITDSLKHLKEKFSCELPTTGVKVSDGLTNKLPICPSEGGVEDEAKLQRNLAIYLQVRTLLVARKMSQLVAKTWINPQEEEERGKISIIQKLILRSNQPPQEIQDCAGSPNLPALMETESRLNRVQISDIILPNRLNWHSINLNLLLAGQAYWQKDDGELVQLNESILSTFDAVNIYAFKLVFNDFAAVAEELQKPGLSPVPPYLLWTFPYPVRPNTKDEAVPLNDEMIKAWADAEDEGGDLPFYREGFTGIEYVVPPYPYMPLSH